MKMEWIFFLFLFITVAVPVKGQFDNGNATFQVTEMRNLFKNSCCTFQPTVCNTIPLDLYFGDVYGIDEDDYETKFERFEECLCAARNKPHFCRFTFKSETVHDDQDDKDDNDSNDHSADSVDDNNNDDTNYSVNNNNHDSVKNHNSTNIDKVDSVINDNKNNDTDTDKDDEDNNEHDKNKDNDYDVDDEDDDDESVRNYKLVFYWHEQVKVFFCRFEENTTVECKFGQTIHISTTVQNDVEEIYDFPESTREGCKDICKGFRCAYSANLQLSYPFTTYKGAYNKCMNFSSDRDIKEPFFYPFDDYPEETINLPTTSPTQIVNEQGNNDEVSRSQDVPNISGMVGGITGGILVVIVLLIAAIFYIQRQRKYKHSRRETLQRHHSVVQETLSDNVYSIDDEPIYAEPEPLKFEYGSAAVVTGASSDYVKPQIPTTVMYSKSCDPKISSEPNYPEYENPVEQVPEYDKYETLGVAPYQIGCPPYSNNTNKESSRWQSMPPRQTARKDSSGYTNPINHNEEPYETPIPDYLPIEADPDYLMAKNI